jgi:eukaryotic-like serine/threonine-protein kinase
VLRATDQDIRRDVAMKVMHGAAVSDEQRQRFINEAQITGQLEHPSIVPVYELGELEGEAFYTMKFVNGRTLSEVLAEEYPIARLLGIFLKSCDAIAFASSRGIIHRDLKPDNIMIGEFGEVLVLDWGLAKAIGAEESPVADSAQTLNLDAAGAELTLEGDVLGTPAYMSPEQARGRVDEIDIASDIYALGAILYTILTHSPPHRR